MIIAERANRKLVRLAFHDPLTGASNRGGLDQLRESLKGVVTAIIIDLDYFKQINDRYGHGMGDEILVTLAQTIYGLGHDDDALFRLGGDEFLLVLPRATPPEAVAAAEAIPRGFREATLRFEIAAPSPTLSVGIATADLSRNAFSQLLSEADKALYRAKTRGRDCIQSEYLAA